MSARVCVGVYGCVWVCVGVCPLMCPRLLSMAFFSFFLFLGARAIHGRFPVQKQGRHNLFSKKINAGTRGAEWS